jgi:hypothetical protein
MGQKLDGRLLEFNSKMIMERAKKAALGSRTAPEPSKS